jgi:hypothetical protein
MLRYLKLFFLLEHFIFFTEHSNKFCQTTYYTYTDYSSVLPTHNPGEQLQIKETLI